jgi:hypothetical protein
MVPWKLLNPAIYGKPQFVEFTISTLVITVASLQAGACLLMQGDPFNGTATGYGVVYDNSASLITINSFGGTTFSSILYQLAVGLTVALGDVIRFSVIPGASGNAVTLLRNGVSIFSIANDNNVQRPGVAGFPGIYCQLANSGTSAAEYSSVKLGLGI